MELFLKIRLIIDLLPGTASLRCSSSLLITCTTPRRRCCVVFSCAAPLCYSLALLLCAVLRFFLPLLLFCHVRLCRSSAPPLVHQQQRNTVHWDPRCRRGDSSSDTFNEALLLLHDTVVRTPAMPKPDVLKAEASRIDTFMKSPWPRSIPRTPAECDPPCGDRTGRGSCCRCLIRQGSATLTSNTGGRVRGCRCDVTFWPDNLCCARGCSAMSSRGNRKDQLDSARITANCNPRPPYLCPWP